MSVYSITMEQEQIDNIVVSELKWAYEHALKEFDQPLMMYGDIEDNAKFINGLETVLAYFITDVDYKDYMTSDHIKEIRKTYESYIFNRG